MALTILIAFIRICRKPMNRLAVTSAAPIPARPLPTAVPLVLNLFGPPRICYQGQPLNVSRRQTRALLFRLGATMEPVARDELAILFWPESDDFTARRNVARLLSLVRDRLPDPQALDATTTSVCLDPHRVWSDAGALMQLERQDTPAAWKAMVDLYGGPFLAGFLLHDNAEYDVWQTTMLEHLRLRCLEALSKLIEYNTKSGDYTTAVHYAQRYLEIDSLAENVHRQLIGLYARLGERGLAQRQFEECVLVMDRELGVEPLPETRAAYERARLSANVAATLLTPARVQHATSGLHLPLLGRATAWQELATAYARCKDGGVILIAGEPGVGKSRLLHAFAAEQNTLVLTGDCLSDTRTLTLHPLIEALRPALPNLLYAEQFGASVWCAEAEQLLPELRQIFPNCPNHPQAASARGQLRAFEALLQVLISLAGNSKLMLCLDDLNWADETTLLWLQYASSRLYASRICICATYCPHDADNLNKVKRNLLRNNLLAELKLEGLTCAGVEAIVTHVARLRGVALKSDQTASIAQRVHAMTGGNAFFVLETVLALVERDQSTHPPAEIPVPVTVQSAIEQRLTQVSAIARQVLEAAAILNAPMDFQLICWTSGRSEVEVSDSLHEVVRHGILQDSPAGLRFRHPVVRKVVYDGIAIWRRSMLEQRAARCLGQMLALAA
jgi:DNA-binding SARP family transcriptional activator